MKLDELHADLTKKRILGRVVAGKYIFLYITYLVFMNIIIYFSNLFDLI